MQRVLLFDPKRVPKTWVEMLRPGQFAVLTLAVETSVIVDQEGVPVTDWEAESCFLFDSLDEAKRFCQELVERLEHVRCEIYDERGKAVEPLYTIVNKRHEHRLTSKKQGRLLMLGGVLAMLCSIPLFWYDSSSRWARIWPTVFGINAVLLGLRLLHWGYGELEQWRRHQREQMLAEAKSKLSKAGD